jgi:hypothetical protein
LKCPTGGLWKSPDVSDHSCACARRLMG